MKPMDVKWQMRLVDKSIQVADESEGVIRDIFLEQASRLYSEIKYYESTLPKKKKRKTKRG